MSALGWLLVSIGLAVGAVVAVICLGAMRLRSLMHRVGSFVCNGRSGGDPSEPFTPGIAHYCVGRIEWYRAWSLSPRPARVWERGTLEVLDKTLLPAVKDRPAMFAVSCRYGSQRFELAVTEAAYAGLASWLESALPGSLEPQF